MKGYQAVIAVAALCLLSGCAFQKQAVRLQPQIDLSQSNLGSGKLTMVNVADERPRATLGTRGAGGIGEQLVIEGDLKQIIQDALSDGLRRQGFATDGPIENQLRVEIRNLDYAVNTGFWAGKLNVEFLLKGICIKNESRPYEQTYRGEYRTNVQVVQGEEANNNYVNHAVNQAVNALLNDRTLIECLAR
ncbi:MAG: YajG family lipoprotein [Proteobacteria bacterium]|nr:YajG family lipoprotein [Pseudomonadota bacterium]